MKKIIFTLALISTISINYSQQVIQIQGQSGAQSFMVSASNNKDEKALGSPYITEDFTLAKISLLKQKNYLVRYNAYYDEIEIKNDNNDVFFISKKRGYIVVNIVKENYSYHLFGYLDASNTLDFGYFIKLNDANTLLLKKQIVSLIPKKPNTNGYSEEKPAQFKRQKDKYFIKKGDDNAIELPKNKKDIAKLFPEFEKDILSFIKKNEIKTNKEEHLIKLINFINTL